MSYHPKLLAALSSLTVPFTNGTPLALLLFLAYFALFLLPGVAGAGLILRRGWSSPILPVVVTVIASSTAGLLAFWAFFFGKTPGRVYCFTIYGASVALLATLAFRSKSLRCVLRALRSPLLYTAATGLFYTALFFLPTTSVGSDPELPANRFFSEGRPEDNLIPLFLADRFYDERPIRPFCCGGWLSSDRPPLQSGVFLLQRPLRLLGGNWLQYQLLATALQCLWVCGVWCLLTALGTTETRKRQVLTFLIFSGFLFYNSVYTWPKLFASALTLFTVSIFIGSFREARATTTLEFAAASGSAGLMFLSHPGSVFSFPAFAVLALRYRRFLHLRQLVLGASIVLCFVLPWNAYQRWFDPPGDRLLKMHLGGETDPTTRSTWQVIRDAYRKHTAAEILRFKLSNLALLFGRSPSELVGVNALRIHSGVHIDSGTAERTRIAQREYIWNALGILNVGWAVGLVCALRSRTRCAVPFAPWLIAAAICNLVIWSGVLFGPGATVTTHSSYAEILLLSIGLLGWILTLPRMIVALAFSLQAANFLLVWVWPR